MAIKHKPKSAKEHLLDQMSTLCVSLPEDQFKALEEKLGKLDEKTLQKLLNVKNVLATAIGQVGLGQPALLDKLIGLAQAEKRPETPGFFGKLGKIMWSSAPTVLLNSAFATAAIGAVSYGVAHSNFDANAAKFNEAVTKLEGAGADAASMQVIKAQGVLEPAAQAKKFMLTSGVISLAMGSIMSLWSQWGATDKEAEMEQRIFDMMNSPRALAAATAPQNVDPEIQAPQGLPTIGQGLAHAATHGAMHV